MLGVEESNARLLKKVTQQEDRLSILKGTRLGMYLFHLWLMSWFFLSLAFEFVVLFFRTGWKSWFSGGAGDSQGGDQSEHGGTSQVPRRVMSSQGELDQIYNVA